MHFTSDFVEKSKNEYMKYEYMKYGVRDFRTRKRQGIATIINYRILDTRLKSALCPETIKFVREYKRAVVDLNRLRARSRK